MIRRLLCRLGLHIYGRWSLTRWNPSFDFFTLHRHCVCGRCQHQRIDGKLVPNRWQKSDLLAFAETRKPN